VLGAVIDSLTEMESHKDAGESVLFFRLSEAVVVSKPRRDVVTSVGRWEQRKAAGTEANRILAEH
jgi:hypothetical protein